MKVDRAIPEVRADGGGPACDICGPAVPATRFSPPTVTREPANYCDSCASKYVGWPESTVPLEEAT